MKFFLKIAVGIVALSFVQPSSATSTFTFTGSTVLQNAFCDAIVTLMGGSPHSGPPIATCKITTTANSPSSGNVADAYWARKVVNSASQVTFEGSIPGINYGNPIKIYCSFSDSARGLIAVYNSSSLFYAPASATIAGYSNTAFSATSTSAIGPVKFALSGIFQNSVKSAQVYGLEEPIIAVIPYVFVANKGSSLTNITPQNVCLLLNNGVVQQSCLTGNPADTNNVYLTGRSNTSGTRNTVLAETNYGISYLVNHYYVKTSGSPGSGTITSLQYWPTSYMSGINYAIFDPLSAGNGGYYSNNVIAPLMGYTGGGPVNVLDASGAFAYSDSNVTIVSCLDMRNAAIAKANGGVLLKYDGNVYDGTSAARDSVRNGGYTLWGYEHIAYREVLDYRSDESILIQKLQSGLNYEIAILSEVNGIEMSTMNASRTGDGELVGP